MEEIIWTCKSFNTLTPNELYQALRLRSEVFIVEQNCPYLDEDNKDQDSWHLMGSTKDKLIAYVRILPAGLSFKEVSIGRVVNSPSVRNTGVGRQLMHKAIDTTWDLFGKQNIRIGAQLYLLKFYESLGFKGVSDIYLEDNIEHIEMVLIA
jgi:ElaA protein